MIAKFAGQGGHLIVIRPEDVLAVVDHASYRILYLPAKIDFQILEDIETVLQRLGWSEAAAERSA